MDIKEHVSTLCALGTLGAAATGFAFAIEEPGLHLTRPGKRKWPGSSAQPWSLSTVGPAFPRRSVSQPHTPTLTALPQFTSASDSSKTFPSLTSRRVVSAWEVGSQDVPSSRGSSTSRMSMLRPKTAQSRNTTDKRESSTSSNWLKRLSSMSTNSGSYSSSIRTQEPDSLSITPQSSQQQVSSVTSVPNKLVKRSVSQRGLSHDEAKGQVFRRPATSHQRSQTFKDILSRPLSGAPELPEGMVEFKGTSSPSTSPSQRSVWRAYFESGFPRKRRKSESVVDSGQIRTIRPPSQGNPIMVLGHNMDGQEPSLDSLPSRAVERQPKNTSVAESRRSRYSLASLRRNSRRRNLTDPSVQLTRASVNGTIFPVVTPETVFPTTVGSPSNVGATPDQVMFNSSPPPLSYNHSLGNQNSTTISDPLTTSSDVDMHMFSDEESFTFHSDTAYDSIATRTTNASHISRGESKLETIFAARISDEIGASPELWCDFPTEDVNIFSNGGSIHDDANTGTNGTGTNITDDRRSTVFPLGNLAKAATPPQSASPDTEVFNITPVPLKLARLEVYSSSPLFPSRSNAKEYEDIGAMLDDMNLDEENEIDWSPEGKESSNSGPNILSTNEASSPSNNITHPLVARFQDPETNKIQVNGKQLKPSIFDWSENQPVNGFSRPKTVHGKQGNGDRSRSSGRKGAPQLHFRSQSVPVNRDGPMEDVKVPSKYPTWRLGYTPVSEEWSDDFEFEDTVEDSKTPNILTVPEHPKPHDSIRSVKIPQSIIDRQPSVHLQFGQVQEFMALVEGLKELRSRGGELQILNGQSKNLWEDAEAIINLATINDDEQETLAPSPASSDPFAELPPLTTPNRTRSNTTTTVRGRRLTNSTKRSVSNVSTPAMHTKARGESLAQARHLLQNMHQNRSGFDSSPREIEIHHQKKLPFDTQDLKDLVVRSGVITRALKEEVRRAEGVSVSPQKTPPSSKGNYLSEMFRAPEVHNVSPCPPFRKPGLPKSHSANSYLEYSGARQYPGPFDSPLTLTTLVQPQFPTPSSSIAT